MRLNKNPKTVLLISVSFAVFFGGVLSKADEYTKSQIAEIKVKTQSKKCQIYRLETSICQKSYAEGAADSAMALEKEATKQSGVVNYYGRYQIGKMKAMHGTSKLPPLKAKYKKLTGRDWTPKTCEPSANTDDFSEEVKVCGCELDISSEYDCPRGKDDGYLDWI